jgi:uncharacterized membrane protein (UPF0136 family)
MRYYDYFSLFAVITLTLAGIAGIRAKSRASLFAGGISAILLIVAALMAMKHERSGGDGSNTGYIVGLVVSIALLGRFLPAFLKTKKLYPGGIMALFSLLGIAAGILGLMNAGPFKVSP